MFATGATLVVATVPLAPAAHSGELQPYDSCKALLDSYVAHGVRDVGPYGWQDQTHQIYNAGLLDLRTPMAKTDSVSGQVARSTGTNTQEADVDEPDIVKTNGQILVRLRHGKALVVDDVSGTSPRWLGRLLLPAGTFDSELLLVGDRVLITQPALPRTFRGFDRGGAGLVPQFGPSVGTRILEVDISDPTKPRLVHVDVFHGSDVSLRQYGDTVRLVTSTPRPDLGWTFPRRGVSQREATLHNRALVRATTINDWLPSVTTAGQRHALVSCDRVLHPPVWSGGSTIAVTTFAPRTPTDRISVALTANGDVVYSSATRLYVASTRVARRTVTDLHAFALDGTRTSYVGSGQVDGFLRDRWSTGRVRRPPTGRVVGPGRTRSIAHRDHRVRRVGPRVGAGRSPRGARHRRGPPVGALVR